MLSSFATFHFLNTFYRTIIYWQRYFYLFRSSFEKIEVRGEQDSFLPIFQDIQKLRQPLCHSRVYNIYFDSYIKPQQKMVLLLELCVVYLLIPTSNHNSYHWLCDIWLLYIFWFLHQTTTLTLLIRFSQKLYIFWFLHQTTTFDSPALARELLYIFWFLHQTTTISCTEVLPNGCISFDSYIKPQRLLVPFEHWLCCISFDSYIKPQLVTFNVHLLQVVYLLIPTSNHNLWQ